MLSFSNLFFLYVLLISCVTVVVTVYDKRSARRRSRRVPEKTLFLLAILGGSAAEYLTMLLIRHKTLHRRFTVGLPLILLVQIVLLVLFWRYAAI